MQLGTFSDFKEGVVDDYGVGRDDRNKAFYRQRDIQGLDDDAPRFQHIAATNPLSYRTREMLGMSDSSAVRARNEMGMGLKQTMAGRAGQLVGSAGADLTQDIGRSIWWLLNAAQASANVATEYGLQKANPDVYGSTKTTIGYNDLEALEKAGLATKDPKTGDILRDKRVYNRNGKASQRNYRSGMVTALGIPTGVAINNALGLLTPFGGAEGYEAIIPNAEDPSKTDNVLAEVATKYLLGRTGNLLPYSEFQKVRPDVSRGEYNAYKAFKWDKAMDFDPRDGDITLPAGVAKFTSEGIHGPEMQFLGRSLPLTTAGVPFISALAGTMAGVRKGRRYRKGGDLVGQVDPNAVKRGVAGGMAGAVGGIALGNLLETERRRRNQVANEAAAQKDELGF